MAHHYRVTVDKIDALDPGGEGLESVSFFAATHNDLFAEAKQLRQSLGCTACTATKLALGRGLIGEARSSAKIPAVAG